MCPIEKLFQKNCLSSLKNCSLGWKKLFEPYLGGTWRTPLRATLPLYNTHLKVESHSIRLIQLQEIKILISPGISVTFCQ